VATFNRQPAFEPFGTRYMYAQSKDEAWQRLTKTIDLTGNTSGSLGFKISYDTENTFDYVVVEAHTVGQDDWTTLEENDGGTEADVGQSCDINWDTLHPFLTHYQTNINKSQDAEDADCTPDGTEGTPPGHWFGATGNSAGWQDWSFDLSAYAGKQVEVAISYIQDFAADGLGVFVDNVAVSKDGTQTELADFESDTGGWTPSAGPNPELEPAALWTRSASVGFQEGPAVTTADTVYYGFGIEGVRDASTRATLVANAMRYLGVLSSHAADEPAGGGPDTTQQVVAQSRPTARARIVSANRLRLDSKGRVAVKVSCAGDPGGSCAGTVKLLRSSGAAATRTMGSKKFRVSAGRTATIRVTMNAKARRSLARKGSQRVVLSISGTDSSGARISVRRTIRVMAAKTKTKH
jgi:hypothetical protein